MTGRPGRPRSAPRTPAATSGRRPLPALLLVLATVVTYPGFVQGGQDEAATALTEILFDMDLDNVSYALRPDGFVDITFGNAVPNETYLDAVRRLRAHPDIPGVLAGRGRSDYCPLP